MLTKVHKFLHQIKEGNNKIAIVFAENDEFEQMRKVMAWFEAQSKALHLKLDWDVTCINLQTLFVYLKENSPAKAPKWQPGDVHTMFKNKKFNFVDLCFFHETAKCRHCAISKVYIYCYLLSEYFCGTFGIKMVTSFHTPLKEQINPFQK